MTKRPPEVQAELDRLTAGKEEACVRSTENGGHYGLLTVGRDDEGICFEIFHLHDSYAPGVRVVGVRAETLTPCGCGQGEFPTLSQIEETHLKIQGMRMDAMARAEAQGLDWETMTSDERRVMIFGPDA